MGYYNTEVGIFKIKSSLIEKFQALFEGKYYKVAHLTKEIDDWIYLQRSYQKVPIRLWRKNNYREKWHNRYRTGLTEDGIFTFGLTFSERFDRFWMEDFMKNVLPYFTESCIERDFFYELFEIDNDDSEEAEWSKDDCWYFNDDWDNEIREQIRSWHNKKKCLSGSKRWGIIEKYEEENGSFFKIKLS